MDSGLATILAAGITGAVVAATFLAGELIRLARDRSERRAAAVGVLLTALNELPDYAVLRALWWSPIAHLRVPRRGIKVVMDVASAATSLYGSLPRRDYPFVDWVVWSVETMPPGGSAMLERAAEISGVLTVYLSDRRRALAFVERPNPDLDRWKAQVMAR